MLTTMELSYLERRILEFFLSHPDRYFSAADVFAAVWTAGNKSSPKTVKVHINSIRRKLAACAAEDLISTVRGAGYILRAETKGWTKNPQFLVRIHTEDSVVAEVHV
jgi:DNA-binding response OmpR family regulator